MFYLTTHSTHYLRLYGVKHMVKDHPDSLRGNPLPPHGLLFYMHHPTDRITHTTAFVTPVVEHWLGFFFLMKPLSTLERKVNERNRFI